MKAVLCHEYCAPRELVYEGAPRLTAQRGQVVVSMKAAGVNFADSLIIKGSTNSNHRFPSHRGLKGRESFKR